MNTNTFQDQTITTIGGILRHAREQLGLSQQMVAEKLCLKVSTVCDIENNQVNPNLASTFLRGYIRSYARLVHISEEILLPMMEKQTPITMEIQSSLLPKNRNKKQDNWLIGLSWLLLFVVIIITVVCWWQLYKFDHQDIINIMNQSTTQPSHKYESIPMKFKNSFYNNK